MCYGLFFLPAHMIDRNATQPRPSHQAENERQGSSDSQSPENQYRPKTKTIRKLATGKTHLAQPSRFGIVKVVHPVPDRLQD